MALAPLESQWLVAPLLLELPLADGGDTEESEDKLCWFMHWATAKPARQRGPLSQAVGGTATCLLLGGLGSVPSE